MSFMDDFEHLKLQLKDIKLATNDFGDKPIGIGGLGEVFKGELSLPEGKKTVAFKRLDRKHGQGDTEFWKEIMMLSQYKHKNLIPLLGFCNEDGERILVYEYALHGSLDRYLGKTGLTWNQLLKICHGAACDLNYLHDPVMHQRVLHRDVKSANILLDEDFTAKISDFGLSKIGPANQHYTYLVSNVVGTPGYCDPAYMEMGSLSKESDVYSFGVVLFEVMCGRYCFEIRNGKLQILVPIWKRSFEEDKLDGIICKNLKEQMDMDSLKTFSNIAYRCLHRDRKERPTMADIIRELEIAIDHQELSQDVNERAKYEERVRIVDQAAASVSYRSRNELALVLSKGILLKGNKRRLLLNKNEEYHEIMLTRRYKPSDFHEYDPDPHHVPGDEPMIILLNSNSQVEASAQFLSMNVTYNINFVYKRCHFHKCALVPLKYKIHTETEYWTSCVAQKRGDNLLSTTLYQFTSSNRKQDFKFDFLGRLHPIRDHGKCEPCDPDLHDKRSMLQVIGIEFLPVDCENNEKLEEVPTIDLDTEWEKKLPSDYAELIQFSTDNLQWTTKRELYHLFRQGFILQTPIARTKLWFSVSKRMKKRCMLSATTVLQKDLGLFKFLLGIRNWKWKSLPQSRFPVVAEFCEIKSFRIGCYIKKPFFSRETDYACYLVYKLPETHSLQPGSLVRIFDEVNCVPASYSPPRESRPEVQEYFVDLLAPTHVPFIGSNVDKSPKALRIKGHPKLRKDGWMEIQIWDVRSVDVERALGYIQMKCDVRCHGNWKFTGLLVQGVEFRPAKVSFMPGLQRL